jgi:aminoglycoside 6'-N-acetyltransferase I
MLPRMQIRALLEADAGEWTRMRCALYPPCTQADCDAELPAYLEAGGGEAALVAVRQDGRLGGLIELGIRPWAEGCDSKNVGYIEGLWVDPDLRRSGLARRLVAAGEAWARARGCVEMGSDCLLENQVSLQFHLAVGYREIERAIHLAKKLG